MDPKEEMNVERMKKMTDEMITAITSPPFVEAMRAVRSAPESERLVEGSRRLSPEALRAQGVPLPSDMRISSRYFESGGGNPVDFGDTPGKMNVLNELNKAEPGFLDRIRKTRPDLFDEIVKPGRPGDLAAPGGGTTNVGGCACGGGLSFCGGVGGST